MHVAVLCSPGSWYFRDLVRAGQPNHQLTAVRFGTLEAHLRQRDLRPRAGGRELSEFDALLVRTMPPGTLEQVVFRMDVLGRWQAAGGPVINAPRAIEAAVDKFLTTARLVEAGLKTPETYACQETDAAMEAFQSLGGDVVLKPLFGGEGRGITRVSDENLALRAFKTLEQLGAVIYLQRFIDHEGCDLRLLRIGQRVWGMRRRNPNDWRTNVSRGALAEALPVTDELHETAMKAANCIGAEIAGVDLLPAKDGRQYILEVNAVPGWKALSRVHDADIAAEVLEHVAARANRLA